MSPGVRATRNGKSDPAPIPARGTVPYGVSGTVPMKGAAIFPRQGMIPTDLAHELPRPSMKPIRLRAALPTIPLALLLAAAACSGGGGGGPTANFAVARLVAASFAGAGAVPTDGDPLLLTFSDAIELTGAPLEDADVELLPSGTLGAMTLAPDLADARTVRVYLGTGAQLTPGTTTIAFLDTTDAVRGLGGGPAPATDAVTIRHADAEAPTIDDLTLSEVDGELAGTGPAGGTLQVPRNGFTFDIAWNDGTSGVDATLTALISDRDVPTNDGGLRAGANLAARLTRTDTANGASYLVPGDVSFPPGDQTITAYVVDGSGRGAAPRTFRFRAVGADAGIRPLDRTQVWYVSYDRDIEQFTFTAVPQPTVDIVSQPNGRADAFDALAILGLWSDSPLANVQGALDSNDVVRARFEARVLTELGDLFGAADIQFTFTSPGTFPSGRLSVPYDQLGFSQICIAGAPADTPRGTLGAALYDPNNQTQNDDCGTTSNGDRLGVFLHTYAYFGVRTGSTSTFRQTFDPFTPGFNGTPIGEAANDRQRLDGTLTDSRSDAIDVAVRRLARSVAVVLAHECGHSMGLVANGPMPTGLYGGDPVNFPTVASSPSLHIENRNLFPLGSQNVMSAAIDFDAALSPDTGFNSLNRAYLRERALYNRQ